MATSCSASPEERLERSGHRVHRAFICSMHGVGISDAELTIDGEEVSVDDSDQETALEYRTRVCGSPPQVRFMRDTLVFRPRSTFYRRQMDHHVLGRRKCLAWRPWAVPEASSHGLPCANAPQACARMAFPLRRQLAFASFGVHRCV
jgi:hypothetical protein